MSLDCSSLYPCRQYSCNRCFSKRLFWLRESSVNFARLLANQECWFSTLKPFNSANSARIAVNDYIAELKALKSQNRAKLEYFYVISHHDYSAWHVHIIANRSLALYTAYHEQVRDKKAVCLYIVKNLEMSRFADYGKTRRYGSSRLLNSKSLKTGYRTRIKLWTLKAKFLGMTCVYRAIIEWCSVSCHQTVVTSASVTSANSKNDSEYRPQTERPPPALFRDLR